MAMQGASGTATGQATMDAHGAQPGAAEIIRCLESLRGRLERAGWCASTPGEYHGQLRSVLLDAANLALRCVGRPTAAALSDLAAALTPLPEEAAAFTRTLTLLEAHSEESAQVQPERQRAVDTEIRSFLERIQARARRWPLQGASEAADWQIWLPWLGVAAVCMLLVLGWWRLTAPVQAAPVAVAEFAAKVEGVNAALRAWQANQSGMSALDLATGTPSRHLADAEFAAQLADRLGESGHWASWRGPYHVPLDFGPEFGRAELVVVGGAGSSGAVYLSFSGVAPQVWKAIDDMLDRDDSGDDDRRMTRGEVLYVPWDHWMAVRLLHDGQRP